MAGIKFGEPTLTCEVFDDEFHEWNIPVLQELERKHPTKFTMIFDPSKVHPIILHVYNKLPC